MSVTIKEDALSRSVWEDENYARKYTKVFEVNTGSDLYDEAQVLDLGGIPARWNTHPNDTAAYVVDRSAKTTLDKYNWRVTVNYETLPGTRTATDNPLAEWPEISMRFQDYQIVMDRDIAGNPILASSKEPFDPPVEETYSYIEIDIQRNVSSFSFLTARDWKNSVNSDDVTLLGVTLSQGDGFCADDSATPMRRNGTNYFREHISILISDRPLPTGQASPTITTYMRWQQVLLDQGLYHINPISQKQERIKDGQQMDVVKPKRLNGSGLVLADTATPIWLPFMTKKTRAWSGLNLPATWFAP